MPKEIYHCRGIIMEIATKTTRVEISLQQGNKWIVANLEDEQVHQVYLQLKKALYERNIK